MRTKQLHERLRRQVGYFAAPLRFASNIGSFTPKWHALPWAPTRLRPYGRRTYLARRAYAGSLTKKGRNSR